jgi:hypothetical protein
VKRQYDCHTCRELCQWREAVGQRVLVLGQGAAAGAGAKRALVIRRTEKLTAAGFSFVRDSVLVGDFVYTGGSQGAPNPMKY